MIPAPWYLKKKFWVAIVTASGTIVTALTGNEKLSQDIMLIGMTLIGAIGLEDFGKANPTPPNGNLS